MENRKCSLEKDYNHKGYFVLYTWFGYWEVADEYHDDEWWKTEYNEPDFWPNDIAKENEEEARNAFREYIGGRDGAELWLVEKKLNEIHAHQLAKYYCRYDKSEEMVISDALSYDEKYGN